jgi:hypothetical protein
MLAITFLHQRDDLLLSNAKINGLNIVNTL